MKKLHTLLVVFFLLFGLSQIEAKPSNSKSKSEQSHKKEKKSKSEKRSKSKTKKNGRKVYDHERNEWPDWGRVDL